MSPIHRTAACILLLCAMGLLSCASEEAAGPVDDTPRFSREAPEDLIKLLAHTMEERDSEAYSECLGDDYLFEFTPEDADLIGLPADQPWWGKTQDVATMDNMFGHTSVISVECSLPINAGPWQDGDEIGYRLEPSIKVAVGGAHGSGLVFYWVFSSWFDVKIAADPYDDGKWVFTHIQENLKDTHTRAVPLSPAATEACTFGGIKSMFK